jgi:hypothetical protein
VSGRVLSCSDSESLNSREDRGYFLVVCRKFEPGTGFLENPHRQIFTPFNRQLVFKMFAKLDDLSTTFRICWSGTRPYSAHITSTTLTEATKWRQLAAGYDEKIIVFGKMNCCKNRSILEGKGMAEYHSDSEFLSCTRSLEIRRESSERTIISK